MKKKKKIRPICAEVSFFSFFFPYKYASKQKTLLFQSRSNILPHILCSGFLASCHFMLQEYWMRPGPRWETCAGLLTGLLSCSLASMMAMARPDPTQPGPTQPSLCHLLAHWLSKQLAGQHLPRDHSYSAAVPQCCSIGRIHF